MSKTQAFQAFRLIMSCLFWIMGKLAEHDKTSDEIYNEMVIFLAREHPNG